MEYNFSFLKGYYPLSVLAYFALEYLETDPNSSVIKQGMILEHIIKAVLDMNNLYHRNIRGEYLTLNDMILIAEENDLLPKDEYVLDQMNSLRKERNFAVHRFLSNSDIAKKHLRFLEDLCRWFMENWLKYRHEKYNADGGTGVHCFILKDDFRLSVENPIWDLEFDVPLQDGESIQDYSKRKLAELHCKFN